jgi:APA family basic amino acid/polyamine antiporter
MTESTEALSTPRLGYWTAVALVMGNMIGSGVFLLPASLAPHGGMALAGWIVSAGGSICLAVVFARLALAHPASGGPYAYTRRAFGELAGFLVAWGYWISTWSATAALAVAFVGYLDPFVPGLVRHPATAALLAIGAVWILTAVNIRGIREAGRVQVVTTALKILPLVAIGIAGLTVLQPAHFAIPAADPPALARSLLATVTLTLWAFLGLECATIPAASIHDAGRTIARATVTGTVLAAVLYVLSTVGVMSVVPPETLRDTTAPLADAARALAGDAAAAIVALGAAISCFGALNGWILMAGQLPLAASRDGMFPRVFGRVSARGTPAAGLMIAAVLTTTLVMMNASRGLVEIFTFVILLSTLSTLVPYVFCSLAGLFDPGGRPAPGRGRSGRASIVAMLAFGYAMLAVGGAGADVVYWGFLLLLAGLPVHVWMTRRRAAPGEA